jgi:uncharacterized protein (UPF0248 family)
MVTSMIPIRTLLDRIRWDNEFGKGQFEVGYEDHIGQKILRLPFHDVHFEEGNRFSFELKNASGEVLTIPFHRVREVYRDGILIWSRPDRASE